jgi:hypothetical protein
VAEKFWTQVSPEHVEAAVQSALSALSLAQAARRQAMEMAMKLNIAVAAQIPSL